MMRAKTALALFFVLGAAACGNAASEDTGSSEGAAIEKHYIQANSPFFWADGSYADFIAVNAALGDAQLPTPLASDDPVTVRLQTLADRVDAIVRTEMEQRFHAPLVAPKPVIVVLPSASLFNAWVTGTLGCVASPPIAPGNNVTVVSESEVDAPWTWGCLAPPSWNDATAFTKLWNGAKARCHVDAPVAAGDPFSVTGDQCKGGPTTASPMAVVAASPYIHVSTDLIAALDEKTMTFVLAHELSHYFRSHASTLSQRKYDIWYDQGYDRRPVPAATAATLASTFATLSAGPKPIAGWAMHSQYSPRLRNFLLSVVPSIIANVPACADAVSKSLDPALIGGLLQGGLPDANQRAQFRTWEAAVTACAPQVTLAATPQAGEVPLTTVSGSSAFAELNTTLSTDRFTLDALLRSFDARARQFDDQMASFVEQVNDEGIGVYTREQEADEMALDLSTKLGLTPDDVMTGWLTFMRAIDDMERAMVPADLLAAYRSASGEIDAASCEAYLQQGFPSPVNIGDLGDPHHSGCYRLKNLWREQKAHGYTAAAAPADLTPAWAEIQQRAQSLSK